MSIPAFSFLDIQPYQEFIDLWYKSAVNLLDVTWLIHQMEESC